MNQLHPRVKWLFRVKSYVLFLVFGIWIFLPLSLSLLASGIKIFVISIPLIFLGGFLTMIIVSEIYARMAYNRWFYEFMDDELKLERGIIWKRYSHVPYERIQNVDIVRGIIARMFGFSSVMIQTAGYTGRPLAEGYIPAVEMKEAEKIRNFVMKKIKGSHKSRQGL